jgi:hypothetical protein
VESAIKMVTGMLTSRWIDRKFGILRSRPMVIRQETANRGALRRHLA